MSRARRPLRAVVLFSSSDKESWFKGIRDKQVSDTVLHAFARLTSSEIDIAYTSAGSGGTLWRQWRTLQKLLSADVFISSDANRLSCLVAAVHWISSGTLGARWILVAVNTSAVSRKTRNGSITGVLRKSCWRRAWRIVCLARFQMADLRVAGVPSERLAFIPFGIDAAFFENTSDATGGEYLLSVGRDSGRDYDYLCKLAPHVPHPIRIIASERNIPRDTKLPDNVSVLYNVPIMEMREHLLRARMVVVPTKERLEDGSDCSGQSVVLQALAAGKPVAASVRPWIGDYLQEGIEFLALPDRDPERAARVLNDLWEDESKRRAVGGAGKRVVVEKFTTDVFARDLLSLILRGFAKGNKRPTKG